MNRSISWIDPQRLAAAMARAGVVGYRPPRPAEAAPAPPSSPARPTPAPAAARKPVAAPSTAHEPRLDRRLDALMDWIHFETGCDAIFVLDPDGLLVLQRETASDLLAVATSVQNLLDRLRAALDSIHGDAVTLALQPGRVLHLLRAKGAFGALLLGFVAGELAPASQLRSFREAFLAAVED